jgi:ribonuclease P protein component
VSRKVGNAVVRNRAKRLIRAAFRETPTLWAADIDLVVIVRRPLEATKLQEVIEEWVAVTPHIKRRTEAARRAAPNAKTAEKTC